MKNWLMGICCSLMPLLVMAQTVNLSGKVINEKNEPLGGITIQVKDGPSTVSNGDGLFSLPLQPGKKYDISFTGINYAAKVISSVEVAAGSLNELNILMETKAQELGTVTVSAQTSTARKETVNALIAFQKNTNTVASVISAESIRRSPDRNTGEVLKRTPGASIQEGKFLVVRGLADRYNQAMLNGILLTSTEPDRKTFSFDLIPASMIDNIIINKAFVPEHPGEWAGGLIQVQTKDIPARNFFNLQVGTGYNTQTTGKTFYRDPAGGRYDFIGIEDGVRGLPQAYRNKSGFDQSGETEKTAVGKSLRNAWAPERYTAPPNLSFQGSGGFTGTLFGKKIGGTAGVIYNKTNRFLDNGNRRNTLDDASKKFTIETDYQDARYNKETTLGAFGGLSFHFHPLHRISVKSMVNVNTNNAVTVREGLDRSRNDSLVKGFEFSFRQNTFYTTQLNGDHTLAKKIKARWYGAFNILDSYVPDQRRLLYTKSQTHDPFLALISNSLSQQSGSRIYQNLSDYIYTAGGDLSYSFKVRNRSQTLKGGYMLQVKDRLYDAKLFANYLRTDNAALRSLPPDRIFDAQNFYNGTSNGFHFDAIKSSTFRYMANTILNAGFLQMDNTIGSKLRVVWGARLEHYDQLVGSVKKTDPRHTHSVVTDVLPGINATYKLNTRSNIRASASQTVIRPELRELSALNLYDFELNASVQGEPDLERTKVTNVDLRYEIYPRAGEAFTAGIFFKDFKKPIEQLFYEGVGGSSTFLFKNPEKAVAFGTEVEMRKRLDFVPLLKNFTLQANAAYIYSRVEDTTLNVDRPLQGQSPYLFNFGLLYDIEKYGLNATILFNQVGHRIYLVGDKSAGAGSPDIYEAPRPLLDLQVAKKVIQKRGEVRLTVSDILNRRQYFYQNADPSRDTDFQKGKDAYRFTRRFGTTCTINFNYSF